MVIFLSLVWTAVGGIFVALAYRFVGKSGPLSFAAVGMVYVVVVSPLTAGVFDVARALLEHESPAARDFLAGVRTHLIGGWWLGLAQTLITLGLLFNIHFYMAAQSIALKMLGILLVYLFVFWLLSATYHYPVLVAQRPSTLQVLKKSCLLALGAPAFTVGMLFVIILFTCLCISSRFLLPLLYAGMLSVLQTLALRALFVKFGILEPEPEPVDYGFHVDEGKRRDK